MQAGRKAEGVREEEGAPSTFFDPASREMQMLALASKSRETPSTKPLDLDAQRARSILAGSRLKLTTHPILEEEAEECVERRGSKKGAQAESSMRRGGGGVLAAAVVRRRDAAALPSSGRRPRPAVNHLADQPRGSVQAMLCLS